MFNRFLFLSLFVVFVSPGFAAINNKRNLKNKKDFIRLQNQFGKISDRLKSSEQKLKQSKSKKIELQKFLLEAESEIQNQEDIHNKVSIEFDQNERLLKGLSEEITLLANQIKEKQKALRVAMSALMSEADIEDNPMFSMEEANRDEGLSESILDALRRLTEAEVGGVAELEELLKVKLDKEQELEHAQKKAQDLKTEMALRANFLNKQIQFQKKLLGEAKKEFAKGLRKFKQLKRDQRGLERILQGKIVHLKDSKVSRKLIRLAPDLGFIRPIRGKIIKRFGKVKDPELNISTTHKGILIRPRKRVNDIRAMASGQVLFAGFFKTFGNVVIVQYKSADNLAGRYYLIGGIKNLQVNPGDEIERGQSLGEPDREVYIEIRDGKKAVNPLKFLKFT